MTARLHHLLLGTIVAAALAPTAGFAHDYPYCLQGPDYGYPGDCSFASYRQCEATASGIYAYCGINPRMAFQPQPIRPLRRHRH